MSIDDDVLDAVKRHAAGRSISIGQAATDLLRRALRAECPTVEINGLQVLDPGTSSPVVRSETVERLLADETQ